ncbi:MAG TPA: pilus assembly protein [Bdellovibrionales bacterium]|nr:pilus assembly protein [Bdellovibrionales bacterium]
MKLFMTFMTLIMAVSLAHAQTGQSKYLSLSVGLVQDESLPTLPDSPEFQGDFKKLLGLSMDKSTKTLRFEPKREGTATLTVHDGRGRKVYTYVITVKNSKLNRVALEIKDLLKDIEGISIRILNNKVVVDGQVLLPKDMNRIISVVAQYGDQAASLVTLSPLAQKKIAEFIERDINNPEIHCRAVNGKFIIEGVANDEAEKQRAEIVAKTYVQDKVVLDGVSLGKIQEVKTDLVINLLTVKPPAEAEPGKIIQLVVHYVELQKDYTKGFRFQFTPDVSDESKLQMSNESRGPAGVISSITATVSNLLPKLNWAKQHGHARILQSSSVIVMDGEEGKLQSVTRVPYQIVGQGGVPSTSFEEAGIVTAIKPKIISAKSDSINLKIDFALKSLLGLTDKGPLISNSSIQTMVVVRSGQSAAIGGLVSNSSGKDYNKLPKNVSDNPLISLYASKSFRRNQSQFVVFITPVIKSSASAGSERIKQKFRIDN